MAPRPLVRTCRLGRVEHEQTAHLQRSLRAAREAGAVDDLLLVLEHDPVITCGTRTEVHEIAYARTTGVPIVPVERGGKATWHGPGQVVAYPIFHIDRTCGDVKELVRRLEQAIIETLAVHGVAAARREGLPGVWVDVAAPRPRKVASVGLRLTRGVSFHGIALNATCDLTPFGWFTPCGLPDAEMTSIARELGLAEDATAARASLLASVTVELERQVVAAFGFDARSIAPEELAAVAREFPAAAPDIALPGEPRPQRSVRDRSVPSEVLA